MLKLALPIEMPQISVIIPAYNAERYIEECLLSLKGQTFKDFEIIIVDDGSIDKTYKIAEKYAKVIKSLKNLGAGAARNLGAKEAQGQILVFADTDVVLPEDWLAKIIKNMQIHNVECVGAGYCGSMGKSFMEMFAYLELSYRRRNMPEFVNTVVSNNFACYRDIFFGCGGFPETFKCEDLRLSFVISKKHKIFWDKDNGIYHHFKTSLKDYLKQQCYFSRDTFLSYCQYPAMLKIKTHQGRTIYFETISMLFVFISLFLFPAAILFLALILMLNYNLLLFLKNNGLSVMRSCLVILIRDVVCVIGIFAGMGLCLIDIIKKISFSK